MLINNFNTLILYIFIKCEFRLCFLNAERSLHFAGHCDVVEEDDESGEDIPTASIARGEAASAPSPVTGAR